MTRKLVILQNAILDLAWFKIYYSETFPEGLENANKRFEKCLRLLCGSPTMGRPAGKPPRRRFSVPDTPYTIVYQHNADALVVVRVLDQRKENCLEELFDP